MNPGAVRAEAVSRRFLVYPQPQVTLKEAILRRRHLQRTEVWAVRDVSFSIESGEAVGVIGRNGSGKTTLLRLIAGIFRPSAGRLQVDGSIASLLELGAGFHPDFTGRENVYMNGAIHGLKRRYVDAQMDEIVSFAELERFIDVPVRTYSAGMYMRLGFSVAAHLDPDILLLDEVFAVGDEAFQRKCMAKILDLKARGRTLVFVSHSAPAVERLCERAILLSGGQLLADGPARDSIAQYQRMLAAEERPVERVAGLREWGTGEARVVDVRLEDAEGGERRQFLSGQSLVVRLRIEAEETIPPPRVAIEFRDANGSLLGVNEAEADALGWDGAPGVTELVFTCPRLPLADGRFQVSVALSRLDSTLQFHRLDPAVEFSVFPDEDQQGWFRFEGDWTVASSPNSALEPR
jgi:ABC-type polysaccharide/polyol phosphate transport system ATPase subunit